MIKIGAVLLVFVLLAVPVVAQDQAADTDPWSMVRALEGVLRFRQFLSVN